MSFESIVWQWFWNTLTICFCVYVAGHIAMWVVRGLSNTYKEYFVRSKEKKSSQQRKEESSSIVDQEPGASV